MDTSKREDERENKKKSMETDKIMMGDIELTVDTSADFNNDKKPRRIMTEGFNKNYVQSVPKC